MKVQNIKNIQKTLLVLGVSAALVGCASNPAHQTYAPATEVITKTVTVPVQTTNQIDASFNYGGNPDLVAAYQSYQKTGKAPNVSTNGFEGFAYDPAQQIYLACQPLHICTVLFQEGELIKDLSLGDTANWDIKTMLVGGTWPDGAELLVIKPKTANLATNLVITTDKRIYNIALLTSSSNYVRQAVFYYPSDTDASIQAATEQALKEQSLQSQNVVSTINGNTNINLSQISFNYSLSGGNPSWKPIRVFDDGVHTFIQFPASVQSSTLPVLFVLNHGENQLVNFRKKTESDGTVDYVVDQIFAKAVLATGVGMDQTKVVITNKSLDHSWF